MDKIDWKAKLTSRKFWAALASFVAMLVVAFGGDQSQATQITALIMAGATVVAYIVGEGLIDAASAGATTVINGNVSADTDASTDSAASTPQTGAEGKGGADAQ
jgi:lipopolysaccharide export LptBFGC system permease protein LptF